MQPLTAYPRDQFAAGQMQELLTAPDLSVDYGVELLDASLNVVEDIKADVSGCVVSRDNYATVHGTMNMTVSRPLAWGKDRVLPYLLLSSVTAGVPKVRWNLGVYLLTTPDTALGENPQSFTVTGYDQLHLLQDNIGDSYNVAAGANVLASVRTVLAAAGITAPVLLDTSAANKVLVTPLTFPQTSSESPTWIVVVNALLASVGYRGVWADWNGAFRSGPYVTPDQRSSEWFFAVGDLKVGIVSANRSVVNDLWGAPNWWRFIQNGLTVAPVENAGQYTATNPSTGLSSQASVGRVVHAPVVYLDAVDQASLVTQGDRIVAAAIRSTEVIAASLSPFPAAWHFDVCIFSDAALGVDRKVQCRSWALPLDGADMTYILETVA